MEKQVKVVGANRQGDFEFDCEGQRFSLFLGKNACEVGDVFTLAAPEKKPAKKAKKSEE